MKINGEEAITKVIAFKDNIFEFGKPYYIKFNDESDCVYTLKSRCNIYNTETINSLKHLLMDGVYGLFDKLEQNDTVAAFVVIVKGFSDNILDLKIPVDICDDSEAIAAGVLSPVEITKCVIPWIDVKN